jgi:hypothetical protein
LKVLKGSVDVLHEFVFEFPNRFVVNNDWRKIQIHRFAIVACVGDILRHSEPFTLEKAISCDVMVRSSHVLSPDDGFVFEKRLVIVIRNIKSL